MAPRRKTTKKPAARKKTTRAKRAAAKPGKLTKRQILDHLATTLDDSGLVPEDVNCKKIANQVLADLGDLIGTSLASKKLGVFMLPGIVKFSTKLRPAIRKGTMVRQPGTGEMVPSKGRPATTRVVARPLAGLKKAVA